jgi:hypothetical protein
MALSWGWSGGGDLVYRASSSLAQCGAYTYGRAPAGGGPTTTCSDTLAGCGGPSVSIEDVERALADPDVVAALSGPAGLYGADPRPCDGEMLTIGVGSALLEVGVDCTATGSGCLPGPCRPVPAGLGRLVGVLTAIDAQEGAAPACKAVFP